MDSTPERGIDVAVRLAGDQSNLARLLGLSQQAIQKWVDKGKPSPEGARAIEAIFGEQCTRVMLDPYLFGPIPPSQVIRSHHQDHQ